MIRNYISISRRGESFSKASVLIDRGQLVQYSTNISLASRVLVDPIITDWRYFDQDKAETKLTSPAAAPAGLETLRHSTGDHLTLPNRSLYNEPN